MPGRGDIDLAARHDCDTFVAELRRVLNQPVMCKLPAKAHAPEPRCESHTGLLVFACNTGITVYHPTP
jgi:hypothetical protein